MRESYKSKPRRTSFTAMAKKLSLNVGFRSRPYKIDSGKKWGKLHKVSRARSRYIYQVPGHTDRDFMVKWVHRSAFKWKRKRGRKTHPVPKNRKQQIANQHHLKMVYGIRTQRELKRIYRSSGCARYGREHILSRLERRIDSVVFRAGFSETIPQARQWVQHGHVLVDGEAIRSAKYLVPVGATVTLEPNIWPAVYRALTYRVLCKNFVQPAPWLLVDYNTLVAVQWLPPQPVAMTFSHSLDMVMIKNMFTSARRAGHRNIQ